MQEVGKNLDTGIKRLHRIEAVESRGKGRARAGNSRRRKREQR